LLASMVINILGFVVSGNWSKLLTSNVGKIEDSVDSAAESTSSP
jgi:hypothetical protein